MRVDFCVQKFGRNLALALLLGCVSAAIGSLGDRLSATASRGLANSESEQGEECSSIFAINGFGESGRQSGDPNAVGYHPKWLTDDLWAGILNAQRTRNQYEEGAPALSFHHSREADFGDLKKISDQTHVQIQEHNGPSHNEDLSYITVQAPGLGRELRLSILADEDEIRQAAWPAGSGYSIASKQSRLAQSLAVNALRVYTRTGTVKDAPALLGLFRQFRTEYGHPIELALYSPEETALEPWIVQSVAATGVSEEFAKAYSMRAPRVPVPKEIYGMIRINLEPQSFLYGNFGETSYWTTQDLSNVARGLPAEQRDFGRVDGIQNLYGNDPDGRPWMESLMKALGYTAREDYGKGALLSRLIYDPRTPRSLRNFFYSTITRTLEMNGVETIFGEVTEPKLVGYYSKWFHFRKWKTIQSSMFGGEKVELMATTLQDWKRGVEARIAGEAPPFGP